MSAALAFVAGVVAGLLVIDGSAGGPVLGRLEALRPLGVRTRTGRPSRRVPARQEQLVGKPSTGGVFEAIGALLLRAAVRLGARPAALAGAVGSRRLGAAMVASTFAVLVAPVLVPVVVAVVTVPPWLGRRRTTRAHAAAVLDGLPEVIDLLAVAVGAGWTPARAVVGVAPRAPQPWSTALGAALERASLGSRLADALDVVVEALGEPARPLVAALRAAELDGAPLGPGLDRLAADARNRRRRAAEEAARRVPVRLLFPLVLLALPAFALLAMAPLVAGALQDLPF